MASPVWPFVGRSDVVDTCRSAVDAGRSVFVAGPAGVGKTQVARLIADSFEASRRVVRVVASLSSGLAPLDLVTDGEPLLLVIDDIPQLDGDTAAVIASMVVQGDIVVVATMRTTSTGAVDGTPPAPITVLWKDDHVTRIDLTPLSRPHLDELLDVVLPGTVDVLTRRRLWELTQGSPLFVRELVRASIDDGSLRSVDGMWRLIADPHSSRLDELIEQRLGLLDDASRTVVELVALGEPVGFSPLLDHVGVPALDAAERSGLVEVVIDERRRDVRIVHPVFADVAKRHVGAARTASLHRDLLMLVESTPMRRRDDIVRAAVWQLRAGGTPVTGDMVLAARRALYDRNEWLAIELASQAAGERSVDALIIMGQAFADLGQPERAVRLLGEFGGDLSEADRALVAIQRAVASFWGLGDAETAERILIDAEAGMSGGAWRDELRAERAVFAATQGHLDRAMSIGGDLLDETKPPRVFVTASIAGTIALALSGRSLDSVALARRAFELGAGLTRELAMSDPSIHLVSQALALSEAGHLADAEQLARVARTVSLADGHRTGQAWFSLVLGRVMLIRGRPSEAVHLFTESAAAFAWMHSPGPQRWALAGVVQAAALIGDIDVAETAWSDLCDVLDHPARMMGIEVDRAEAWLEVSRGHPDVAIERLSDLAAASLADGALSLGGAVLHDVIRLGGTVDSVDVDRLAGAQGVLAPTRAASVLATSRRDAAALEEVAAAFAAMGADLFASEAFLRSAAMYQVDGRRRDAARCEQRAAAMHRLSSEDWIATLAIDHGTISDDGGHTWPTALTEREHEIAALAAAGRSNREIADDLFVSIRTVENHLQHVYEKLGVRGRRNLSGALAPT